MRTPLAAFTLILSFGAAGAASLGQLNICKENKAEDYDDANAKWWKQEVAIPAGTVFLDVGRVDDNASPSIRLRVVTLQDARLYGDVRCAKVSATMAETKPSYKFGSVTVGPLITSISPEDKRVLTSEGAPTPGIDLPPVEATISAPIR